MRKILKNTPKTKKYLDSLPKIYAIFQWAKYGIREVPFTGKYQDGVPLVYEYCDFNGECDEYRLMPVCRISSGGYCGYYHQKALAELVRKNLNESLKRALEPVTNFKRMQSMSINELAEWLDKNGSFDDSPWLNSFNEKYCEKCESIECHYADAKEKLGITPFYDDTIECAYCELADESGVKRCRFFPELNDVPDNKEMIKMWLEGEVENNV